jgi:hypothetical protein
LKLTANWVSSLAGFKEQQSDLTSGQLIVITKPRAGARLASSVSCRHFLESEFLAVCCLYVRDNGARRNILEYKLLWADIAALLDFQKTRIVGKEGCSTR